MSIRTRFRLHSPPIQPTPCQRQHYRPIYTALNWFTLRAAIQADRHGQFRDCSNIPHGLLADVVQPCGQICSLHSTILCNLITLFTAYCLSNLLIWHDVISARLRVTTRATSKWVPENIITACHYLFLTELCLYYLVFLSVSLVCLSFSPFCPFSFIPSLAHRNVSGSFGAILPFVRYYSHYRPALNCYWHNSPS